MQDKNSKSKNDKTFLIVIIVFLLMLCISTFSGCAFLVWKSYPTIYILLMNKNSISQNTNIENNTETKGQENVFVPVKDDVTKDIKTTYYDISGFTSEELRNQMGTLGPESTSSERHYAMTNYSINWSDTMKSAQGCTPVEAQVNIEYIMPRWVNYAEASQDMQQKWDTFYALLEEHEQEHTKITEQEGQKFLDEIKNIKDYNTCQEFEDAIYPIQEKYLLETSQLQEKYDDETNHGVISGVVLY